MASTTFSTSAAQTFKQQMAGVFATEVPNLDPTEAPGFVGKDEAAIIQVGGLEEGGDQVTYNLLYQQDDAGIDGDGTLEGNEGALSYADDAIKIDQKRFAIKLGGRMSEQRVKLKLRKDAVSNLKSLHARWRAELFMTMLTGKLGTNRTLLPASFTGFAGNTLTDVDSDHLLYAGNATAKADVDSADTFTLDDLIDLVTKAKTVANIIEPIRVQGKEVFLVVLHPYVVRDLKKATGENSWGAVERALLTGGLDPSKSNIIKGAIGMYHGCVLIESQYCGTFSDYGAGSNVAASRVILLGKKAGVVARGKGDFENWMYNEETFDYGNQVGFAAGQITGMKATIFASKRYAMLAMDCAAAAS
jgi:N4-gp56 family major capsid protein